MNDIKGPDYVRCPKCRIHPAHCFCESIKVINNSIPVSIIMHHREDHLSSNTATLANSVLLNSKILRRGLLDRPFEYSQLDIKADELPLFLFPHETARVLDDAFLREIKNKKVHLVIPDGSWGQAKKVYRREHGLNGITCVKLPDGIKSCYRLRKSPREDGVCTFEAISHALKILESQELHDHMMSIFQVMVKHNIQARTSVKFEEI